MVRGASYRLCNHPVRAVGETGAAQVDRGTLYITNKRCSFDGRARQLAIGVHADGFVLEKSVGKSPFLTVGGDAAPAAAIAAEALARDWT